MIALIGLSESRCIKYLWNIWIYKYSKKYLDKGVRNDYFAPNIVGTKVTTEIGPRLTQVLDDLGIKDGNKILT